MLVLTQAALSMLPPAPPDLMAAVAGINATATELLRLQPALQQPQLRLQEGISTEAAVQSACQLSMALLPHVLALLAAVRSSGPTVQCVHDASLPRQLPHRLTWVPHQAVLLLQAVAPAYTCLV